MSNCLGVAPRRHKIRSLPVPIQLNLAVFAKSIVELEISLFCSGRVILNPLLMDGVSF